ncbi:MAG: peptidoglycan DD-metalloendopeptidase family protein [Aeromicrobium sp.]|uniref:peptidoglycan DD-metalloendopeptidase family protein n=1 Tax=Aeromicrobium sp. TaxID=1871063 RepID=UPI0039E4764A
MSKSTRKAMVAFTATFVVLAMLAGPSLADSKNDLENQKNGVNNELGQAQQAYDESSKEAAAAAATLQASQAQLSSAQAELSSIRGELVVAQAYHNEMLAKLAQSEADLAKAEADLESGEQQVETTADDVADYTVDSVMSGDPGLRAFGNLLRGQDPTEFTEQMGVNDTVADSQLSKLDSLDARRVMLDITRQQVEALRDQVRAEEEQAAANVATVAELESQAAAQEASVAQLVSANAANKQAADAAVAADAGKVDSLESERASLEAQLKEIAAQELAAAQAAAAAAAAAEAERQRQQQQQQQSSGGGASSGGGTSSGGGASSGGGTSSGGSTLSYPVSGSITSPYGMRWHPVTGVYKLHDGTDFGVGCGTPIKAAASGTVIDQYYNGGYGNRVIVNHGVMRGVNVVTTYNHLSRFAVSKGASVSRGQVIGYVGSTGYSTGCHLHFMVLTNGSTTNPVNWL